MAFASCFDVRIVLEGFFNLDESALKKEVTFYLFLNVELVRDCLWEKDPV